MQFGAQRAQRAIALAQFSFQEVCLSVRLVLTVQSSAAPLECQGGKRLISELVRRLHHAKVIN
jgi:hypothetical protein